MKKIFLITILLTMGTSIFPQKQPVDTSYITSIVSAVWIPDGKSLLIAVVKYHKTDQQAPFFSKVYRYYLNSKQLVYLFDNGSNLAPSPDGKRIAFLKRNDNKRADIWFYNTETKQETVLKTDTLSKNALSWSPDGKKLVYNVSHGGTDQFATIDICVLDLQTKQIKQITQSGKHKNYSPVWCPDSKRIVYYFEKGDDHDQIWLTDMNGSFHTNLTSDTSTHNYFPSWFDEYTIIYTQSPSALMMLKADGTERQKIEGIEETPVRYNFRTGKFVYIKTENENKLMLFDYKKKTATELIDGIKLVNLF